MEKQDREEFSWQEGLGEREQSEASSEFGERILSVIEDSVNSMDFRNLSDNIQNVLEDARDEAMRQIDNARERQSGQNVAHQRADGGTERFRQAESRFFVDGGRGRKLVPGRLKRNPGLYSGPAEIGLGGAGVALFGGLGIGFGMIAGSVLARALLVFAFPTIICAGLLGKGIWDSRRARRIRRYASEWMGKSYVMIEDLAEKCGVGRARIVKDIRFLTGRRLLPGAALDREETCLMLTDEARGQYEAAVKERDERERRAQEEKQREEEMSRADPSEREVYRIKKEGRQYLKQIGDLKVQIQSAEVRQKLDRMEVISARIFVCAAEHPESISHTDKLFRYYFPSVVKLVQVYEDMEEQPVQGENIRKTKTEIEASLDTMNHALEKLFDEMFQDVALDVSSDIKVLEVMLRQDGLAEDGMKADSSAG